MRLALKLKYFLTVLFAVGLIASCDSKNNDPQPNPLSGTNPFNSDIRNKIVVISDIHLGQDPGYAEFNINKKPFLNFLNQIKASTGVKEIVIAGDLLDEWFVPATADTYRGGTQNSFVKRIAANNHEIVDAINAIIDEGVILVTYVPGNHDLCITEANINAIFPNIKQARDTDKQGLGTYRPVTLPAMAIEHGHRYNFFCAPDPISNQDIAPGTIQPPGYFFTRIAALHVYQKCKIMGDIVPTVEIAANSSEDQKLKYAYWKDWKWTLDQFPIKNKFNEKMIITNVDGFTETYAVNDILPFQSVPEGDIDMVLYKNIQKTWDQRQTLNNVAVKIPADSAIINAPKDSDTDKQAEDQYFKNSKSDVRLVLFGHTHNAMITPSTNLKGEKTIYVNSGTWIDSNPERTTMDFVVITPQTEDANSQTYVSLYNFKGQVIKKVKEDFLRL